MYGGTETECKYNLTECLRRLKDHDLHLNLKKCSFLQTQIEYLGHVIQHNKISKSPAKIQAINTMPRPSTADDVRRFLGMITYYARFIPEMSSITYPLRQLLQKNRTFYWSSNCEAAFLKLKNIITSDLVLMPFDPELPVIVACDASPTGIAGVLSHIIDGKERPVAFASRSLTSAEQNYSQLDREALAIIFTINHFFMYLYGRKFKLMTDNRPLTRIFHQHNKLPPMTSARLLRYAEFLSNFEYEIIYKKGSENTNVDCLSRATQILQKPSTDQIINDEVNQLCLLSIFEISNEVINADVIASETAKDPDLSSLLQKLLNDNADNEIYTLNNGVVFKGQRVLVPKSLQPHILHELHHTHSGITKMKQLARRYCYWKGIDGDIEKLVRSCEACVQVQSKPAKAPLHQWEEPAGNWDRIHIDYAGPFQNHFFLIVIDAKSRWAEMRITRNAPTTGISIKLLSDIFASHGYPVIMVSDNATVFTSGDFKSYCNKNGIFQKLIAPGHPSTNGLA